MIASVRGEVIGKDEKGIIVNVHGVGLFIHVPDSLIQKTEIGEKIYLQTNLIVREDNITLYGFQEKRESQLFDHLIKVNGVGPRLALAVLSSLPADSVYQAVITNSPAVFNQVPGIGNKTAQKIVLFLHDKFKSEIDAGIITGIKDTSSDLLDALVSLGYSVVEAQMAIQAMPDDAPDSIDEQLRLALSYFAT